MCANEMQKRAQMKESKSAKDILKCKIENARPQGCKNKQDIITKTITKGATKEALPWNGL